MKTTRSLLVAALTLGLCLAAASAALAERSVVPPPAVTLDVGQEKPKPQALVLPYAFNADSLDWAFGLAGGANGYLQDQAGLFAAVMDTTNSSKGLYLVGWNIRLPWTKRLFVDPNLSWGRYTDQRYYVDGNPQYAGQRAGSNDSAKGDYVSGEGDDNWLEARLRYVLPLGDAADKPVQTYVLKDGLLHDGASGGREWNPLTSGVTTLELKAFYRERSLEISGQEPERTSSGLDLAVVYNNSDFPTNPSRGSVQRLAVTRDFGWFDQSQTWTTAQFEISKYVSFEPNRLWRQGVLALNAWTAHCLTWEETPDGRIDNRPPTYQGANLGGFWRMRGYPVSRFNDRSAIYYAAEFRLTPQWQPIPKISWLKMFKIDWWQFAFFGEAGRVADNWSLTELNSDLKWDAGVGLRLMAIKSVVRLDMAYSDEGLGVWAMVGQPF